MLDKTLEIQQDLDQINANLLELNSELNNLLELNGTPGEEGARIRKLINEIHLKILEKDREKNHLQKILKSEIGTSGKTTDSYMEGKSRIF